MIKEPTERNMVIYEYIVKFMMEHQYSPTVREIGEGVGLKSVSPILGHLLVLKEAGLIDYEPSQSRTIRLMGYKFVKVD
jgi:repressor LexA